MTDLEYDAIIVDTSIFIRNGLKLESGLLGKLEQFAKSDVEFLVPDIIYNEILKHLIDIIRKTRSSLVKAINDADIHLFPESSALQLLKSEIIGDDDLEKLGRDRLDKFLAKTSATSLACDDHTSIREILEQYFSNKPPFPETGSKKNEFPDAIVLIAIENWAVSEDKYVLAVSTDKDWEAYCSTSERISYTDDFSHGLSEFNTATAPFAFISNLTQALSERTADKFVKNVDDGLKSTLSALTPDQEADSYLYWEPDGCDASYDSFTFSNFEFKVVSSEEDWAVIEVLVNITIEAEGHFTLYAYDSIDHAHVPLPGTSVITDATFLSEILITVSGDLAEDINNIEIEDIEIVDLITSVDFGTIEPDFDEYD